jgi:hypothetical protein
MRADSASAAACCSDTGCFSSSGGSTATSSYLQGANCHIKKAREQQKWEDVLLFKMLPLAATMHAEVGRTELLPFPSLLPLVCG